MERNHFTNKRQRMKNIARMRVGTQYVRYHPLWILLVIGVMLFEVSIMFLLYRMIGMFDVNKYIMIIFTHVLVMGGIVIEILSVIAIIKQIGENVSNDIEMPIMKELSSRELRVNNMVMNPFLYSYEYKKRNKVQTLRINTLIDIDIWKAHEEALARELRSTIVEHVAYDYDSKLTTNIIKWVIIDNAHIKRGGVLYDDEL